MRKTVQQSKQLRQQKRKEARRAWAAGQIQGALYLEGSPNSPIEKELGESAVLAVRELLGLEALGLDQIPQQPSKSEPHSLVRLPKGKAAHLPKPTP